MPASHNHVPSATLKAQVRYLDTPAALLTAQAIVGAKLRNCYALLGSYRAARVRAQSDQVKSIDQAQRRIRRAWLQTPAAKDRQALFLLEAQAGAAYWRAFRMLSNAEAAWQRVYPHALDVRNVLLNTGYTILGRHALNALLAAKLFPEVGLYHGDEAAEALAYDVMECFRQVAVDAVILPLFSRRGAHHVPDKARLIKWGVARMTARMEKRFPYHKRCERLDAILQHEVVHLREAILAGNPWQPYQHRWGHSWKCSSK